MPELALQTPLSCPPQELASDPTIRRAGSAWRRARSSPSDGWRRSRRRCRRGSTRKRGCGRASKGLSGTSPCRHRPGADRARQAGRSVSAGRQSPATPRRDSSSAPTGQGIRF